MSKRILELDVTSLGSGGDGIADSGDDRIYIPLSAPGDHLRVQIPQKQSRPLRGKIVDRLKDGPDRQAPICRHFSICGGCSVQHIRSEFYLDWKQKLAVEALSHRGIDSVVVENLVQGQTGNRRRTRLHARHTTRGVVLGYRASRSHRVNQVAECPVLVPAIVEFIEPLAVWSTQNSNDENTLLHFMVFTRSMP